MIAAPRQRAEMVAAHRAAAPSRAPAARAPLNATAVLELGDITFFTFRGRPFGVPPVPRREGQRLHLLWLEARSYESPLTFETGPKYHAAIAHLPALLWHLTRPVGRLNRALRFLGLLRNPFEQATEQELIELAMLFLSRRRMSSIGFLPATTAPAGR